MSLSFFFRQFKIARKKPLKTSYDKCKKYLYQLFEPTLSTEMNSNV